MSEDEPKPVEPELRFGAPTEQEVERSRNLKLIVGLLIGPTLLLTILGYGDAAVGVFVFSIGVIVFLVKPPFHQRYPWEEHEDEVIELGLEQRPTSEKPEGFTSFLKTNFRR